MFELRSEERVGVGSEMRKRLLGRGSSLSRIPIAGEHRGLEELKVGQCDCRSERMKAVSLAGLGSQ